MTFTSRVQTLALCLGLCTASGVAFCAAQDEQARQAGVDTRLPITLETGERAVILAEMRAFLSGVQGITAALSRNDMKSVAATARTLGRAATHDVPPNLMQKLPQDFRRQGFATHADFDQIALDAEQLGDANHSLTQLSETLMKCVACHATYRLTPDESPAARQRNDH